MVWRYELVTTAIKTQIAPQAKAYAQNLQYQHRSHGYSYQQQYYWRLLQMLSSTRDDGGERGERTSSFVRGRRSRLISWSGLLLRHGLLLGHGVHEVLRSR